MKAISIIEHGAPDVLSVTDIPAPLPKENEVLIKVAYAGVNRVDVWMRKGNPAYPIKFPHIPGADAAGTVASLGEGAEGVSVGDRVLVFPGISCGTCAFCLKGSDNQCDHYEILGTKRPGTYAEYVAVPDQNVVALPDSLSFEDAAAFPLAYLTAWHLLVSRANIQPHETLLVTGAGSGVGAAAIQIAKWKGAQVLATTSSRKKVNKLKMLGAQDVFFDEKDSDFSKWALKQTSGIGVDVALEHVGPQTWEKSLKSLGKLGRLVTCGATSGPTVSLDLRFLFSRDISILGGRMGTLKDFQELSKVVFLGEIKPIIDKVVSIDDAASAHDYMEAGQQIGKILIKIS